MRQIKANRWSIYIYDELHEYLVEYKQLNTTDQMEFQMAEEKGSQKKSAAHKNLA